MGYVQHFGDDNAEKLGQRFREIGKRAARPFGFEHADDAAQRIVLELWQKRDAISEHANPEAYVASIIGFRKLDILEENGRRLREEVSLTRWDERASTQDTETGSFLTSLPEPLTAPDPYEAIAEREEKERMMADVRAVVGEFPPNKQYMQ
jgi:DNA-directed RNA polymerase specialized sigma24 family protein